MRMDAELGGGEKGKLIPLVIGWLDLNGLEIEKRVLKIWQIRNSKRKSSASVDLVGLMIIKPHDQTGHG